MFPCSHSSARLNKTSYETGHYKIGPPFPWSFKKPFLSPSPHWTCVFWTHSVRCVHSFSERLEGHKCFLLTTAALQRFQSPAFSLASHSTCTRSTASLSHGPLQAISAPPSGVLEGPWVSSHFPQQGRTTQVLWLELTCLQEGCDSPFSSFPVVWKPFAWDELDSYLCVRWQLSSPA